MFIDNKKPKILITNDDGINAPGIRHLWNSVKDFGDVVVIAPEKEQSAVGLAITVRNPLHVEKGHWSDSAVCVNGTPADCVKLGIRAILKEKPDLVLSGINRGSNAGRNMLYSGTVGGAIEGTLQGIPSIAFSCEDYHEMPDFKKVEKFIIPIVQHVLDHPLPKDTLLNVNFPQNKYEIKGFKLTRHGMQFWAEDPARREHPAEGKTYYWLGARLAMFPEEEDCDIAWLRKGYVTGVPIRMDQLTHHDHLEKRRAHFESLFPN